ncbi:hypothetical protein PP180_02880 [Muricauda sp. SK9]|uniref:hypothetical protein n=1 Tax=Flavobacteriaceae TaxID=49546 RepID=UPI0011C3BA33|nr:MULTISPECIES: hypothetical protein [Allomuricauda]MDC6384293.1 hypothetical protein [Muricauda sp. SK9]
MKTTLLNISKMSLLLFLGLGTILISCSGEDGKDGIDGEMGPAGQDGNANVIVSDWMPFVWSHTNEVDYAWMDIPVENILDFAESGGVVMVYLRIDYGGTTVRALPMYSNYQSYEFAYGKFGTSFTGIRVFVTHSNLDIVENDPATRIRYVLIPANIAQTSGITNQIPKEFDEIANLLGLEQ